MNSSQDLVERARAGDQDAFNELLSRYERRVRAIVRLRMGPALRSRLESSDVVQDTFYNAIRAFDRFEVRDDSSVINWLARIAERCIRTSAKHFRADKRDMARDQALESRIESIASGTSLDLVSDVEQPIEVAQHHEEEQRLATALAALRPEYREVIALRSYAGMSWCEVAEELGSPSADAARMLHARAVAELSARTQSSS